MSEQRKHRSQHKISLLSKIIATGLFSGYFPIAPGTAGSVVGILIYWFFTSSNLYLIFLVAFFFVAGVITSSQFERRDGHDPAIVVIDEVVGMWISLIFLPKKFSVVAVAFFLFRLMDVIKPFPAKRFDRMKGGAGIMLDDVVAGIYANIITRIFLVVGILK